MALAESLPVQPAQRRWLLLEAGRTLGDLAVLPLMQQILKSAPKGDGHPVLVLPGFLAGDGSTSVLRKFLSGRGYEVYPWELGRNLGLNSIGEAGTRLEERLEEIHDTHDGDRVSVVGWSLGGVMAREMGKQRPELVRQVISMGSPFSGHPQGTAAWPIYKAVSRGEHKTREFRDRLAQLKDAPEVPTTSIFSRTDGIVHWTGSIENEAPHTDNIEVRAAHCGLGFNAPTLYAVADRLAQDEHDWKPFHREGWREYVYPSSGH